MITPDFSKQKKNRELHSCLFAPLSLSLVTAYRLRSIPHELFSDYCPFRTNSFPCADKNVTYSVRSIAISLMQRPTKTIPFSTLLHTAVRLTFTSLHFKQKENCPCNTQCQKKTTTTHRLSQHQHQATRIQSAFDHFESAILLLFKQNVLQISFTVNSQRQLSINILDSSTLVPTNKLSCGPTTK